MVTNDLEAWFQLSDCFREMGQYEDALIAINQVLVFNPRDAEAWHKRGLFLLLLRRDAAAIEAFRRAVIITPTHARARYNLAVLLRNTALVETRHHLSVLWRHDPDMALLLQSQLDPGQVS